jgi:uncharacterized protein (DUF488 family)
MTIYTIGYSNKNINTFIEKLVENSITLVVDIRSKPRSRNPQFNRMYLERYLANNRLNYLFMGDCLGGLEINHNFDEALDEVVRLSETQNMVLMCVEKNPKDCHRYRTIAPELKKRKVDVCHLLWDKVDLPLFNLQKIGGK